MFAKVTNRCQSWQQFGWIRKKLFYTSSEKAPEVKQSLSRDCTGRNLGISTKQLLHLGENSPRATHVSGFRKLQAEWILNSELFEVGVAVLVQPLLQIVIVTLPLQRV